MPCPSCGTANKPGRKFCSTCGSSLQMACASCGTPYEPDERFCGECGAALAGAPARAATPPAAPASTSAAELRQVSVLFCDLVGYTSLSESRDAEDMRELLSGYFDIARRLVERYGGVVEKFIGDAVMAVWGSPVAREDDAERAVRAALELVSEVARYGEKVNIALQARAGVVTGQAASWSQPGEGLVVGDRVNTAARIQSAAEPDTVFVDDVTKQVTLASIAYADAGQHTVKGKSDPLQLWRAVRVVAGKGGAQRIDGLEAGFAGRSRELNLLKELFHACREDGRARLVTVTGQAGVGKSRLRWEFDKYVDGMAFTTLWHSGRCLSYGDGVAYWALAEMVRQRMGIAEEDPNDVAAEKLDAGLERYIGDAATRQYLRPALGALVGAGDAGLPREELFAAWRLFFESLAAQDPVVLVFEDMQWADPGLLDFIEQLLDWSAGHRIFVLSFARSELTERRPDWVAGRRNVTPLYLDALPEAVMTELLDDLVPGLPPEVAAKIASRAEGIPLYAVEMVRGLIDRDIVVPRDGVYRLVAEVGDLDLPASLTALISARLDALAPAERATVRQLSVLGGTFPRASIAATSDLPVEELDGVLHSLMRKEILTVHSDPLSPDRGQYAFVQSLMRTVAYETLSRHERKKLHTRVAEHLRGVFPDDGEDVVEVIATHYRDAYSAAGSDPEADELRRHAVEMFTRAAKRARAVGAPENAVQAYRTAAELCSDDAEAAPLIEAAGDMSLLSGRGLEAHELFERAAAVHLDAGRAQKALMLRTRGARGLAIVARLDDALAILRDVLAELDPDSAEAAQALVQVARTAVFTGDGGESERCADRAMIIAQNHELPDVFVSAATIKALVLSVQNRPAEALLLFNGALSQLGDDGSIELRLMAHVNVGDVLLQSDLPGADTHARAVMELSARTGDRRYYGTGAANLALWHILKGEWDEAERVIAELVSAGSLGQNLVYTHLVTLAALRGQTPDARANIDALATYKTSDDIQDRTLYAAVQALISLCEGDYTEALGLAAPAADQAFTTFGIRNEPFRLAWPIAAEAALRAGHLDRLDDLLTHLEQTPIGQVPPYLRAHRARLRGLMAAGRREYEVAEQQLARALGILGELGYRYWHSVVAADLAETMIVQGRMSEAAPLLADAAPVLAALRAAPQQTRVARLQGSFAPA